MKDYKIFRHPQSPVEAVKQGWSWPAFFFTGFWALFKKMWGLGLGSLAAIVILGLIIDAIVGKFSTAFGTIVGCVFASYGNKWRENSLLSRGYDYVETVRASNPEGAIATYLKKRQSLPTEFR